MTESVIEIKDLKKSFGPEPLFHGLNLSIKAGEKVGIIGPGGCGKSILIKMALGLMDYDQGSIHLFGEDLKKVSLNKLRQLRTQMGVAFQQGALFDYMTVGENLDFAMRQMSNYSKEKRQEKVTQLLTAVKLSGTEDMMTYELSGGMQRRVGIARALSVEPKVAVFDEPTSGLDPVTSTIILNMIADLAKGVEDSTQIILTTNVEIAIRFSRRLVVINEGEVVADGDWHELITNGSEWVQKFLGLRLIGLDRSYAVGLNLPDQFFQQHWGS